MCQFVFFSHNPKISLLIILLGGIYRLGVKLSICVQVGLDLRMGQAARVRRQGLGHCSQALDTHSK